MKTLITILLLVLPTAASAELIIERDFEHVLSNVASDGVVEVDNTAGEITIHGTNRREVRVKAELDEEVEGVEIEQSKNTVSVRVKHKKGKRNHGGAEIEIWVPEAAALDIAGVSAEISVDAVRGEQRLKSISGEIHTLAYAGNVTAASVSGDVVVEGHGQTKEVRLESVSGDVEGINLHGDIHANSVSGDVAIVDARLTRGRFASTSGNLEISASISNEARLDFETVSGDIDFRVLGKKDGSYDVNTFSGDIDNCFGPEVDDEHHSRLRFAIGDEKARIRASTMSGDISICD